MGIFDLINSVNNLKQQTSGVKNARKNVLEMRDRLRNTPQFADAFHKIISNPEHPPMKIVVDYSQGNFFSMDWDVRTNNYEPYTTVKHQDANIAYYEGCAIFLLIQECYPNVYDFPNLTLAKIENYVPIELNMKKDFMHKRIIPTSVPQRYTSVPVQAPAVNNQQVNSAPKFCGNCGSPLQPNSAFCTSCGSKIS